MTTSKLQGETMAIEITVPRLGWSMEEGTFAGWLKREGDFVRKGDLLFALEGDKATQEIESFDEGVLRYLPDGPRAGETVKVGQVLAHLVAPGESGQSEPPSARVPIDTSPATVAGSHESGMRSEGTRGAPRLSREQFTTSRHASPRARRRAHELGVDWTRLSGSGKTGRIRERDVIAAATVGMAATPLPRAASSGEPSFVQPLSAIRRAIAERLVESHRTTAPVTLTATADASNLVNLRAQFRAAAASPGAIVPSYTDFIVKLTATALGAHPVFNSRWDETGIAVLPEIHVGIAVDTDAGLLVPVVRHVERLSLRSLAAQSRECIEQARSGRLAPEQMRGGTFTVTNLGAYGIDAFTPIINPPQCAILGLGRIRKEAVYVENQLVARDLVTLSLTFDHRIADGGPAARFLQTICRAIENPAERLIE